MTAFVLQGHIWICFMTHLWPFWIVNVLVAWIVNVETITSKISSLNQMGLDDRLNPFHTFLSHSWCRRWKKAHRLSQETAGCIHSLLNSWVARIKPSIIIPDWAAVEHLRRRVTRGQDPCGSKCALSITSPAVSRPHLSVLDRSSMSRWRGTLSLLADTSQTRAASNEDGTVSSAHSDEASSPARPPGTSLGFFHTVSVQESHHP